LDPQHGSGNSISAATFTAGVTTIVMLPLLVILTMVLAMPITGFDHFLEKAYFRD
jgi:hypothetical protein